WTKVFISNRHTKGPTLVKGELKETKDEDYMLFGSHIIAVEVRSPDKAEARTAPYPIPAPFNNDDIAITDQARKAMESFPAFNRKNSGLHNANAGNNNNNQNGAITLGSNNTTPQPSNNNNNNGGGGSSTSKTTTQQTLTAAIGKDYPHVRPLQIWR